MHERNTHTHTPVHTPLHTPLHTHSPCQTHTHTLSHITTINAFRGNVWQPQHISNAQSVCADS